MVKFYSRHGLELLLCPKILWCRNEDYKLNTKINTNTNDIASINTNNVLWSGGYYMTDAQRITLSQNISDQSNGIVLIFSAYANGEPVNYQFTSHFVPKEHIVRHPGAGITFDTSNVSITMRKYLYISNNTITGYANNGVSPSNGSVLRYVIGV